MSIAIFTRRLSFYFIFLTLWGIGNTYAQSGIIDTISCDSIQLMPSVMGTSYSWSNAATSSSLTVYQSDTFWVDITTGSGTVRDSFAVWIAPSVALPVVSDTNVCEGDEFHLSASSTADNLVWYQDSVSAQTYIGTGNPIPVSISDTTLFVAQGINYAGTFNTGLATTGNTGSGRYYSVSNERGIIFDVFEPIVLRKVTVYANSNFTATVQLRNGTDVYFSELLSLSPGANTVTIDVFLQPGTDYRMALSPTTGGNLYIDLPFSFPIANSFMSLRRGFPQFSHYNFFYDWEVSPVGCSGAPAQLRASVLPTPDFELGNDTLLCGASSFPLDATFPGAQYIWSTGATTASISLMATDSVWAEAYIGGCAFRDSIVVQLLDDPNPMMADDTSFCGPGLYQLVGNTSSSQLLWFADSSVLAPAFAAKDSLEIFISDTTTFYREAVNLANTTSAGFLMPGNTGNGNYYAVSNERGILLSNEDFVILQEVTVYANNSFSATVELRDTLGNVMRTTPVQIVPGGNTVSLDYYLPPSGRYFLMLTNLSSTGQLYIDLPTTFPLVGEDLTVTSGTPLATHYNFFYDLKVARIGCRSSLTPFHVNILPVPEVDLGGDTLLCGTGPLLINTFYPGATYLWSTGDTGPQLSIPQSDTVSVTVTLGNCAISDTLIASITPVPSAPVVSDTSLCGPQTIRVGVAQPGTQTIVWFADSLSTAQSLFVGDSLSLDITESRKVFAQTTTLQAELQVGLDTTGSTANGNFFFISEDRGLMFDVFEDFILKSVTIYCSRAFESEIKLTDANGKTIAEKTIRFQNGKNVAELGFYLSQGSNYSLTMVNPGTSLFLDQPFNFPIGNDFVSIKQGFPATSHYNFFYDWRILPIGCTSERSPLSIDVSLPLNLPDTIYICEDTILRANMTAATYSWNTGSMLPDITIDSTGRYILTVTDGAGCTVMDTTRAGKPKPVELGDDGILCGTTLFSGYNINEGKILWSTGDTTGNISLSTPGPYWVMVEETNGCMLSDTINVTAFENIPSVMLGPDVSACEEATLMANIAGAQYLWNTGDTTQQINATLTGSYWLQVTNTAGCVGGDTLNVNITRKPSALFSFVVNINDPAKVNFFNLSSLGGSPSSINFEWDFGDGGRDSNINTSHTYLDSGTYTVRLIVTTNCGADTFEQVVMIDIPVGIEDIIDPQEVAIFPNPATNALYIRFKKEVSKPFLLSMYDAQGRLVEQRQLPFATKDETLTFEVSTLAKGMYYLRFAGGLQGSQRVMLIR